MSRSKKSIWSLLIVFLVAIVYNLWDAGVPLPSVSSPAGQQGIPAVTPFDDLDPPGWYAIYFTVPGLDGFRGGPDSYLIAALDSAKLSIDAAVYDLNLWGLRDALIEAHQRGVQVRVVTESNYLENPEMQEIIAAGIPVVDDRNNALMHDKFLVIDRSQVWTGSMNFTINGAYRNDNNLVVVNNSQAAQAYLAEFNEMFEQKKFGDNSPNGRPTELTIEGTPIEIYFSPDDGAAARIVELVEGAQESVYFMAFSFTSDDIADAIIKRARAGVTVQGVMDESQVKSNTGGEYENFVAAGLDVRLDGNPDKMHHKVIIIDGQIVITGSYNFSASAENRNDENVLILFDAAAAQQFLAEWVRIFELSK